MDDRDRVLIVGVAGVGRSGKAAFRPVRLRRDRGGPFVLRGNCVLAQAMRTGVMGAVTVSPQIGG